MCNAVAREPHMIITAASLTSCCLSEPCKTEMAAGLVSVPRRDSLHIMHVSCMSEYESCTALNGLVALPELIFLAAALQACSL